MTVLVASDQKELEKILVTSVDIDGPVYIRMARYLPQDLFGDLYSFEAGKGYQIEDGTDITLISTGISSMVALNALEELKKENISARMVHFPCLKPADNNLIVKCARETKAIITVEDHSIYGGLGGLVSEITSSEYPIKVVRIGMEDKFGLTATLDFQLEYFGITAENILEKAKDILKSV